MNRCGVKNFKMATVAAILDIETERFCNSECLCCSSSIKFWHDPTYDSGGDVV